MEKHNYLCGALVERAYAEAGARHAKAKEADRAARRELPGRSSAARKPSAPKSCSPRGRKAAMRRFPAYSPCTPPRASACRLRPWTRFTRNCLR